LHSRTCFGNRRSVQAVSFDKCDAGCISNTAHDRGIAAWR
jgi:hypothetical protein